MPPKRKAAASKALSLSQPDPQRPTRVSGRKRRHSDDSIISETPSIEPTTKTAAKRRKKAAAHIETEAIVEEAEEEISVGDTPVPTCEAEAANVQHNKHVHFGSDTENVDPDHSSATNITPHPRAKMTIKRRTLSPNVGSDAKRIKTARTSLPASLSQDIDPVKIVSEWKFAPLRAVLGERIRRLLQLKEGAENSSDEELEDEDVNMHGDDMLVLDNHEEITYPQLPAPLSTVTTTTQRVTQTSAVKLRAGWDEERQRFHDAILAFEQEAERAKADLRILTVEVESLGFGAGGAGEAGALEVLRSIRESFDDVHEFLETELPGTVPENATNQDVVEILIANVKEFADRLRVADKELIEKGTLNADLGNQVHTLVDKLAEREVKYQSLQDQRTELEESLDAKDVQMQELEETLQKTETERDERQVEVDEEFERAEKLEGEKGDLENTLDRLTTSLENYRTEETRLTELITKMEDEHRSTVASMNVEREQTVRELENNLDAEMQRRNEVQQLATERQAQITDVESQLEEMKTNRVILTEQRDSLQVDLDEANEANGFLQNAVTESGETILSLEDRITRIEEEMLELQDQLSTLREQNSTEREQREAAEEALDGSNEQIEELNRKLRDQGKEANELRLKAHEIQTKNQKRITELEQQMSDQDAQFQEDIAEEVTRREEAEALTQERDVEVQTLKVKLAEVESQMRKLLIEKDARIAELEAEVVAKDNEIEELQTDLRNAEDQHAQQIQAKNTQIAQLQTTIEEHEESIRELQQEAEDAAVLHDSQTEERDAAIANLNHRLATLEADKAELENDKTGLERRVESEAMQMLQVSNDFQEQVDDLKAQLLEKQNHILKVQNKSHEAETKWTELLDTKEQQIDDWKLTTSTQEETITTLTEQNAKLSEKFRAYVRRSTGNVEQMQRMLDDARAAMDEEAERLRDEGEDVLAELESLVVPLGEVRAVTTTTKQTKQVKRGRRKRVEDSGVGKGDEEMEMVEA